MSNDSRAEIAIVLLAGVALAGLWFLGRSSAAASSLTAPVADAAPATPDLTIPNLMFDLPPGVQGYRSGPVVFQDVPLPPRSVSYPAGQTNSCGCNDATPQYFGSVDDLIAYINDNPMIQADFEDGLRSYQGKPL